MQTFREHNDAAAGELIYQKFADFEKNPTRDSLCTILTLFKSRASNPGKDSRNKLFKMCSVLQELNDSYFDNIYENIEQKGSTDSQR